MLAAVGAAVGFGCDLCSHVKPVSRGVGCGDSTRPKDARWKKRSGWTVQSEQGRAHSVPEERRAPRPRSREKGRDGVPELPGRHPAFRMWPSCHAWPAQRRRQRRCR